jgi:hypothetical protein
MAALNGIRAFGDVLAIPDLQVSASQESDPLMKSEIQHVVKYLQALNP